MPCESIFLQILRTSVSHFFLPTCQKADTWGRAHINSHVSVSGPKVTPCNPVNGCKGSSSYWLVFSLMALTGSMNTHRAAEQAQTVGKKPWWCCFQKLHTASSSWDHSPYVKVPSLYVMAPGLCCHLSCTQTLFRRVVVGTDQRHNRDHSVILMLWVIKSQYRVTLLRISFWSLIYWHSSKMILRETLGLLGAIKLANVRDGLQLLQIAH